MSGYNPDYYQCRKERFARIVADHTPMSVDHVHIHRWTKDREYNGKWRSSDRVLEMPRPINLERLCVCLHEVGHAYFDEYCRTRNEPPHVVEQVADEYMRDVLKVEGLSLPFHLKVQRSLTIEHLIAEDIKAGHEIDDRAAERVALGADDLREMGAKEEQLPWNWRKEVMK